MAEADTTGKKVQLTVVSPTAEGIAALVERLTGQKPDLQRIQAKLDAQAKQPD